MDVPVGGHDQLVVIRREGQQIARAAHRFCASSEVTGVLAGKLFGCSFPDRGGGTVAERLPARSQSDPAAVRLIG
jgi:hypothetical protein